MTVLVFDVLMFLVPFTFIGLFAEAYPDVVDRIADRIGFGGLPNWME